MAEHIWTAEDVADHFEEAFRTLRKLPPVKGQSYFNAWPQVIRTEREILAMEPEPMRVWLSAAAISRLGADLRLGALARRGRAPADLVACRQASVEADHP